MLMNNGPRLGGVDIIELGAVTKPNGIPTNVVTNIPIKTAPNKLRRNKVPIIKKVIPASSTLGSLKLPTVISVGSKATIMPAFLRPITPKNRPTPAVIA